MGQKRPVSRVKLDGLATVRKTDGTFAGRSGTRTETKTGPEVTLGPKSYA